MFRGTLKASAPNNLKTEDCQSENLEMSNPYASPEQSNDSPASATFIQDVRGAQIVTAAMAIGASTILGVMLVVNKGAIDGQPDVLAWIGVGIAVVMFTANLVISSSQLNLLSTESLQQLSIEEKSEAVVGALRGRQIKCCAMLEGAAVINCTAYMIEDWIGSVAIAALLIVIIVLKIPSVAGMQNKVADRLREIEMR